VVGPIYFTGSSVTPVNNKKMGENQIRGPFARENSKNVVSELDLPVDPRPPGLPDGLFSNQKYQFRENFEGLRLENVDIFWSFGIIYRHLGNCMTIWYILCSFGTFIPVLVS
jgi:hypothetical protein